MKNLILIDFIDKLIAQMLKKLTNYANLILDYLLP